ncbi:ABC transporter ATP-binding protein [Truepera radiovictrix]|uniref:ABC transporter related protein n=1 Tax=Truepera radiovictrix (strain DSM 17093 / CIP 108686 / LMG 22925 / RQ-24) TaxID=649638 RepID=D7CSB0_TRURR|nr:ABC transporter ATP-binding protein [Truepera radiovictrix]ADI13642.1 ABC transporter related protein [Truepera radiovictrix DSM 17093]WMT57797.1 ABC transporter ATP-binding protein [Truepera radiovictrix]
MLPSAPTPKAPPLKRYGALLGRYLRPQGRKVALMATLLLASIGLQLVVPQILRFFIDTAEAGGALDALVRAALLFLGAALVNQLLSAAATYYAADVGWSATNAMRADLARHALGLDLSFHTARTPGEMIERIDGDVTALANFFSQFSVRVLGGALMLLGILVILWLEHAGVGLALTLFVGCVFGALYFTRNVAVAATRDEREASAQLFGFVEERLSGLDDLRANGGGAYTMHAFNRVAREFFYKGRRAWMKRSTIWMLSYGMFTLGDLITLGAAIYLYSTGAVTLGTAYLFFQYMLMLEAPVEEITQQMQELQKAGAGVARIDELFALRSELPRGRALPLPEGALGVSFERLSFAYGDARILDEVSFRLEPGKVLGLLGRTGSGKTTLTRLLLRHYDASAGSLRLGPLGGGVEVRDIDPDVLRRRIGLVTQEVQLFHASVRDNLTFFDPTVPDERITAVLHDLGLGSWLAGLENGLDTLLAAGGSGLSAGQAQLLAFARVFLTDPGLVILDEPSSRLDPATEALLERAVDRLLAGRTAIIIAHRLKTVRRADDILVLEGGRVLEHGPRARLARDPRSRFYRLLRAGGEGSGATLQASLTARDDPNELDDPFGAEFEGATKELA